jgi:hypothetical protein
MKVGSLVVCVNDTFKHGDLDYIPNRPEKGKHYFVRSIRTYTGGKTGLCLEELINPPGAFNSGLKEPTFLSNRFREIEGLDLAVEELIKEEILI